VDAGGGGAVRKRGPLSKGQIAYLPFPFPVQAALGQQHDLLDRDPDRHTPPDLEDPGHRLSLAYPVVPMTGHLLRVVCSAQQGVGDEKGGVMSLHALLVLATLDATWRRDIELPFPPFPGMGIRIDVYDMLNVRSVVVGDPGYDVTCIVELESAAPNEVTEEKCEALGFEVGPYP
jgi:hypothetical protein